MQKKTVWVILLLLVVGGAIFFLTRSPKEEVAEEGDEGIEEVVQDQDTDTEEETPEPREEYEYTGDTDFSAFSSEAQVLGEESEAQFTIEGIEESSKDGYHEFVFSLSTEDEEEPFVTASYVSSIGVVRMDFRGIETDKSGIGYQQERAINENGVLRIYRNISGQEERELYDIGVSQSTIFYLQSEELDEGEWNITLQVKYPGATDFDVDLGSDDFSEEQQSIQGVSSDEGATIPTYTYSTATGLLQFVWSTSSTVDNPIPSVTASYNDNDELVVVFESLASDRVAGFSDVISLPSSITVEVERDGDTSTYTFSGMQELREFKLSASLSPNQVVLEIK